MQDKERPLILLIKQMHCTKIDFKALVNISSKQYYPHLLYVIIIAVNKICNKKLFILPSSTADSSGFSSTASFPSALPAFPKEKYQL